MIYKYVLISFVFYIIMEVIDNIATKKSHLFSDDFFYLSMAYSPVFSCLFSRSTLKKFFKSRLHSVSEIPLITLT